MGWFRAWNAEGYEILRLGSPPYTIRTTTRHWDSSGREFGESLEEDQEIDPHTSQRVQEILEKARRTRVKGKDG